MILVLLTLLFLMNLFLTVAFMRRGQVIASFASILIAAFIGVWICATVRSYSLSDKGVFHDYIGSVFERKPTRISEFKDKTERKEQEEKKAQEQKTHQKNETEWVCTIVDDQKICTRQDNEAREDDSSEWDCVTEGNRKICIKHGAEKWY